LLDVSLDIFQNIKFLPFVASILVVVFTYLVTIQFCQKRFAGIIAVIVLLQSYTFLKYTKAYVAPFFLMTLFTTYRSQISRRTKIAILISYFVIVSVAITLVFVGDTIYPDIIDINSSKFILGFQVIIAQLRFDLFFIMALLPVTVGLMFLSKNKLKHADSILILIFGIIIASPILVTFTYHYEILPYRFIPLLVFFSIGVGMFFSKNSKIHV